MGPGRFLRKRELFEYRSTATLDHRHTDGRLYEVRFYELRDGRGWVHNFNPKNSKKSKIHNIEARKLLKKKKVHDKLKVKFEKQAERQVERRNRVSKGRSRSRAAGSAYLDCLHARML